MKNTHQNDFNFLKQFIDEIPDFPKPGILFYDLAPLLSNPIAWNITIENICNIIKYFNPNTVVGIESRGFLVSSAVALKLNVGCVLVRKKGKTPGNVFSHTYDLEYGFDTLEIRQGLIKEGSRVVILDDVLATGGTINATNKLLEKAGANVVGAACILELAHLKGRSKVDIPINCLLKL